MSFADVAAFASVHLFPGRTVHTRNYSDMPSVAFFFHRAKDAASKRDWEYRTREAYVSCRPVALELRKVLLSERHSVADALDLLRRHAAVVASFTAPEVLPLILVAVERESVELLREICSLCAEQCCVVPHLSNAVNQCMRCVPPIEHRPRQAPQFQKFGGVPLETHYDSDSESSDDEDAGLFGSSDGVPQRVPRRTDIVPSRELLQVLHEQCGAQFDAELVKYLLVELQQPALAFYAYECANEARPNSVRFNGTHLEVCVDLGLLEAVKTLHDTYKVRLASASGRKEAVAYVRSDLNPDKPCFLRALACVRFLIERGTFTVDRALLAALKPPAAALRFRRFCLGEPAQTPSPSCSSSSSSSCPSSSSAPVASSSSFADCDERRADALDVDVEKER